MSVREYVGARYVPLFADPIDWDATRTYEPLTVVLYQGNSYTSRQYVPANINISNTTYWAQTGNYNAQVEQYRTEVQNFSSRLSDAEEDASDALAATVVNAADIDALETSFSTTLSRMNSSVVNCNTVNNGVIQYTNELIGNVGLQGSTPFSTTGNYSFNNASLYFASMLGADNNKYLRISDCNGNQLSRISVPNGHYGVIFYDNISTIYALNYQYGDYGDNLIYAFDVSNPNNVSINSTINPPTNPLGGAWSGMTNYKDNKVLLYKNTSSGSSSISDGTFYFYTWDFVNDPVHLIDIEDIRHPALGTMAHFSYDESRDFIYRNGNEPNTISVYDATNGNFINAFSIPAMFGFSCSGEVESFVVHGNDAYIASRFHSSTTPLEQQFYFDLRGMSICSYSYGRNTKVYIDYQNIQNGRCYYDTSSHSVYVKYVEQAVAVANALPNVNAIQFVSEYAYIADFHDVNNFVAISASGSTSQFLHAMKAESCANLRIELYKANFIDDSVVSISDTSSNRSYKVQLNLGQYSINRTWTEAFSNDIGNFLITNSIVNAQNIAELAARVSFVKCGTIANAKIANSCQVLCTSATDVTSDSTSTVHSAS